MDIVDMPDRRAGLLVQFIRRNNGTLSKAKRSAFSELSDDEIVRIEQAVSHARGEFHGDRRRAGGFHRGMKVIVSATAIWQVAFSTVR
jgi:hypothetical protein